ncbi:MAG: hypothetical protein CMJ67_06980 [Planctomycetaceae bacterium]|nr:hypothetical protein [Planctomycetaceae bacterium]
MNLRSTLCAAGLVPFLTLGSLADDRLSITDLAPEGTFMVFGADDIEATCKHFNATPLAGLWKTDAVQDLVAKPMGEMMETMMESLDDAGGEDEPSLPRAMGFAQYVDLDEETGMSRAFILGFAEWDQGGEEIEQMMEVMLEAQVDEGGIRMDSREVRGREVMVIETIEEEMGDDDDFGGDFDAMMMLGDPSEMAPDLSMMFVVRDEGRMVFANDLLAIDDALATIDGKGRDGMSSTEDWKNMSRQLGDCDAYLGLMTDPLQDLLAPMFMGPLGLVKPMIDETFGDVRGYGFAASIPADATDASMVITASILCPGEKQGLMSLITEESATGQAPPAVVGADSIGYGRINVDFKGMVPLFKKLAAALPMGGEEMEMYLDQFGPMMEGAMATMGPVVHTVSTVSRPIEIDSAATTMIIPTSDPEKVQPLLSMFGPSMGLEPRDFAGETLWSSELDGMAAAVAGNWVVLGSPRGVEQVVRGLGDKDAEGIEEMKSFRSAVAKLPDGDAVGWGWVDLVSQYAVQRETMEQTMDMLGGGAFDEFAPETGFGADDMDVAFDLLEKLTPEDFAKFMGPSVWNFTMDDLGWTYRQWFLAPMKSR